MAIKKSQLYSALWDGCDELRGGMDASQYNDYVLVVLFVKLSGRIIRYIGDADTVRRIGGYACKASNCCYCCKSCYC